MKDRKGEVQRIFAYEMEVITMALDYVHLKPQIYKMLGLAKDVDIERPVNEVDLLVGTHEAGMHPVMVKTLVICSF